MPVDPDIFAKKLPVDQEPCAWKMPVDPERLSISSVETVPARVSRAKKTPGRERVQVHIDSGAIDIVGPRETAKAFKMKDAMRSMSKRECHQEQRGEEVRWIHRRRRRRKNESPGC